MNLDLEILERVRFIILTLGWPTLIIGSAFLTHKTLKFYNNTDRNVIGKLVLIMVAGWFVSMYSLGILATSYMITDLRHGVSMVIPIFIIWAITMALIAATVLRWTKEATTLNAFYKGLGKLVQQRTEELKQSFKAQREQEEYLQKIREKFISVIAHEIRTPITSIGWGLADMMDDKKLVKKLSKEQMDRLNKMKEKNDNLALLLTELLKASKTQDKNFPKLPIRTVDVKNVIKEIRPQMERTAKKNSITLEWKVMKNKKSKVKANPLYLQEILTNFITNAIKYNKENGWIKVWCEHKENALEINVQDNGIGMTKRDKDKLFKDVHRASENKEVPGNGLGLFISKQLVDLMDGKIWVESKKGKGSTFTASLPKD